MSSDITAATSALAISENQEGKHPEDQKPAADTSLPQTSDIKIQSQADGNAPEEYTSASPPAPEAGAVVKTNSIPHDSNTAGAITATQEKSLEADKTVPAHEEVQKEGPLVELNKLLPQCVTETGHQEMWGINLTNIRDPACCIVLQKFLKANNNNPTSAAEQLKKALAWRKEFRPLDTLKEEHSQEKFQGLGYVTRHKPANNTDDVPYTVITWNIYGGVKDKKATFTDVEEFCRWRVALMEQGIQALRMNEATAPIPEDGNDMYRMVQVHDYMDVSFLRLDPAIKAASSKVIEIFQTGYPELLEHKYFVNVPYVMNWIFNFFSMFMAKETIAKFHPLAKGTMLSNELPTISASLPGVYGGQAIALRDDKSVVIPNLAVKVAEGQNDGPVGSEDGTTEQKKPQDDTEAQDIKS